MKIEEALKRIKALEAENAELKSYCDQMVPIVLEYTALLDRASKNKVGSLMSKPSAFQ